MIDAVGLTAVIGASLLVLRADYLNIKLNTSPVQYTLLLGCSLCFHRRGIAWIRNLALTMISFGIISLHSIELALSLKQHYVFGLLAGSALYSMFEDRIYKDYFFRKTVEKQRQSSDKQLSHLRRELESLCLPHQLDLIYAGRSYTDTMPTNEAFVGYWPQAYGRKIEACLSIRLWL